MSNKRIAVAAPVCSPELLQVMRAIRETEENIRIIETNYNRAEDFELLESYIYELKAQRTRHSYLLRQARRLGCY